MARACAAKAGADPSRAPAAVATGATALAPAAFRSALHCTAPARRATAGRAWEERDNTRELGQVTETGPSRGHGAAIVNAATATAHRHKTPHTRDCLPAAAACPAGR